MKDKNTKPDASEFGQLRAFLATVGFSQAWINEQTGSPNELTRSQLTDNLRVALKVLPKEQV